MNKELENIIINWGSLGATLANLSDEEQKPFFKAFAKEMLQYPSSHQTNMQLCFISEILTDDEKEVYRNLGYVEVA